MSNSDKEFEECNKTMSEKQNDIDLLQTQSWCPTCGQNERASEYLSEYVKENKNLKDNHIAYMVKENKALSANLENERRIAQKRITNLEAKVKELEADLKSMGCSEVSYYCDKPDRPCGHCKLPEGVKSE